MAGSDSIDDIIPAADRRDAPHHDVNDVEATLDLVVTPCGAVHHHRRMHRARVVRHPAVPHDAARAASHQELQPPALEFGASSRARSTPGDVIVGRPPYSSFRSRTRGCSPRKRDVDPKGTRRSGCSWTRVYALPETTDGIAGGVCAHGRRRWSALLVVETSDPLQPAFAIPLTGATRSRCLDSRSSSPTTGSMRRPPVRLLRPVGSGSAQGGRAPYGPTSPPIGVARRTSPRRVARAAAEHGMSRRRAGDRRGLSGCGDLRPHLAEPGWARAARSKGRSSTTMRSWLQSTPHTAGRRTGGRR